MSYCYISTTISIVKNGVTLAEIDCEAKCEYSLPDGPSGLIDWDVTAFYFAASAHAHTEIERTEPLFGALYAAMNREWIDEQLREALAQDGIVDLYPAPAHD